MAQIAFFHSLNIGTIDTLRMIIHIRLVGLAHCSRPISAAYRSVVFKGLVFYWYVNTRANSTALNSILYIGKQGHQ